MLILPGTPLLLSGVDPREPLELQRFRAVVHRLLGRAQTWRVTIPGGRVPPLLSLGGLGIGVGVRTGTDTQESQGGDVVVTPSDVLRDDALAAEVRALRTHRPAAAAASRDAPIGVAVAVLVALAASRTVRLVPTASHSVPLAPGQAEPVLVPVDFSGAAHPDAPLQPRRGAADFDEGLEAALSGVVDPLSLARLHERSEAAAACTDGLAAVDLVGARAEVVAAVDVHRVRYRLMTVASAADAPVGAEAGRPAAVSGVHG